MYKDTIQHCTSLFNYTNGICSRYIEENPIEKIETSVIFFKN